MHYAVPALLQRAGMLAHFYTDAYVGRGSAWHALAQAAPLIPETWRPKALQRLLSRQEPGLPSEKVTAYNLLGLAYALAHRRAGKVEDLENAYAEYGRRFCEQIFRNGLKDVDGIYTFEGGSLPLLLRARQLRVTGILEKFSAPQRLDYELVSEEHRLWEGWEPPYPEPAVFQKRFDLEEAEWDAADAIFCGSDFVSQGLAQLGVAPGKLHTIPYGVELTRFSAGGEPWDGHRPLRLLFVGAISLRKGAQYVYAAVKKLGSRQVDCRMVGPASLRESQLGLLRGQAELTGRVPRQEVGRHYQWADVFVFPTICEGSATVTYEALAAGLPVITTPNAGSVVRDGVDGFIVPIRDAEALAARIELLLGNSALLRRMSENAIARAGDCSWPKYEARLVAAIREILD